MVAGEELGFPSGKIEAKEDESAGDAAGANSNPHFWHCTNPASLTHPHLGHFTADVRTSGSA